MTRHDVEKLAAPLLDRPSQRNRVLSFVSRIFTLTERWEWRPQHTNPVRGIERSREEPRKRILSDEELASLSTALKAAESTRLPSVAAIRVAALTGLRISEVIAMRWADVVFKSGRVTLPQTKTVARIYRLARYGACPSQRAPSHQRVNIHVRASRPGDILDDASSFCRDRRAGGSQGRTAARFTQDAHHGRGGVGRERFRHPGSARTPDDANGVPVCPGGRASDTQGARESGKESCRDYGRCGKHGRDVVR